MARSWYVVGCPEADTPVLGSFEAWCRTIGGILDRSGIEGFLGNVDELYEQADPTQVQWEAFLRCLRNKMPEEGFTAAEVTKSLATDTEMSALLPEDVASLQDKKNFSQKLGNAFRGRKDRRHGEAGLRIVRLGADRSKVATWAVKAKGD